jgi:hypothetical protein
MTRDQAISRMLAAFPTASDGTQLANDMVFAQRLLMALQALELVKLDEAKSETPHEGRSRPSAGSHEPDQHAAATD